MMHKYCKYFIVWLGIFSLLPLQAQDEDGSVARLRGELDYIFADPSFAIAHWGVAIQSLKTGEYFYLRNEHKAFMPAPNMKLFTTAAALLTLGSDYRFVTKLFANGLVDPEGVLQGDLVIVGCGDPSLSGRWSNGQITLIFEQWADSLKSKGIKAVAGKVVGDDRYFSDEPLGAGWAWDDISDYYAAQISALTFNDNCVDIIFNPGDSIGAPASFKIEPNTSYVQVVDRVLTGRHTNIVFRRSLGANQIICSGTVAQRDRDHREWFTVENPTKFTVHALREILQAKGLAIAGEACDVDELPGYLPASYVILPVATHTSPPLSEIVKVTNKDSNNLFAELLLRVIGRERGEEGSATAGEKEEKRLFEAMGIDPEHLSIADGSGLSRLDLVTPMSVIKLLRYMRQQPAGEVFFQSLPIAGFDGTIKKRMRYTTAKNNVRAKTGSIGRVRTLSGYVTTLENEELVFSIMVNNYAAPSSTANYIQDLVCERLANFTRR